MKILNKEPTTSPYNKEVYFRPANPITQEQFNWYKDGSRFYCQCLYFVICINKIISHASDNIYYHSV